MSAKIPVNVLFSHLTMNTFHVSNGKYWFTITTSAVASIYLMLTEHIIGKLSANHKGVDKIKYAKYIITNINLF